MVVTAWIVWSLWTMLSIFGDARSADRALRSVRADLDVRAMLEGDGLERITRTAARFEAIDDRLDTPLLAPFRIAPVIGRQLSAASHQSDSAAAGLRAAGDLSAQLEGLVDGAIRPGAGRIAALREIAEVAIEGRATFEQLDLGPDDALVGPLADSRRRISEARDEAVDVLGRAATASEGLAAFFDGPGDYLLLAANNAQMQNGQGMFLSAGVLHVEDGRFALAEMEATSELAVPPPSPVPLDDDLAARWGWLDPNGDFRHIGLSHRFPVAGKLAADLWRATGGAPVDGTIAVDPFLLQVILRETGPVAVGTDRVRPDNIVRFALHDQYLAGGPNAQRRERIGEVAVAAVNRFDTISAVAPEFLQQLARVASGRHLLAWSADPTVQAGWEAARIHGQIGPTSALLSVINRSGNKLDWFLRTSSTVTVAGTDEGYEVVMRIRVANQSPAEGQPSYVIGPYPGSGLAAGDYLGLVTLNLPEGAAGGRFEDVDDLAVAGGDGDNRTIATWVRLAAGESTELVARFELPASMTSMRIEPGARAQPTQWAWGSARWTDAVARTVKLPAR